MTRSAKKKNAGTLRSKARNRPARSARKMAVASASKPAKAGSRSKGPSPKPVVIDVYAHVLVPEVMKSTYEHSQYARNVGGGQCDKPQDMPEPLLRRMTELPLRLKEMDATGVDI